MFKRILLALLSTLHQAKQKQTELRSQTEVIRGQVSVCGCLNGELLNQVHGPQSDLEKISVVESLPSK